MVMDREEDLVEVPVPVHIQDFFQGHCLFINPPNMTGSQERAHLVDHAIHQAGQIVDFPHFHIMVAVPEDSTDRISQAAFQGDVP